MIIAILPTITMEKIKATSFEEPTEEISTTTTQPEIDWEHINELDQWFPTGVPRHPGVPFVIPRGAAS